MLIPEQSVLLLIDVQGKLAQAMHDRQSLFENLQRCIRGAQLLGMPILWLEQYPQGLGPTVTELAELMSAQSPIAKTCFSCCGSEELLEQLAALQRRQLLVCGIETHVCVYQSVADLLARDYQVEVIADAVSSRDAQNKQIGLQKMTSLGARLTCTEMWLLEMVRESRSELFKPIQQLIK